MEIVGEAHRAIAADRPIVHNIQVLVDSRRRSRFLNTVAVVGEPARTERFKLVRSTDGDEERHNTAKGEQFAHGNGYLLAMDIPDVLGAFS